LGKTRPEIFLRQIPRFKSEGGDPSKKRKEDTTGPDNIAFTRKDPSEEMPNVTRLHEVGELKKRLILEGCGMPSTTPYKKVGRWQGKRDRVLGRSLRGGKR